MGGYWVACWCYSPSDISCIRRPKNSALRNLSGDVGLISIILDLIRKLLRPEVVRPILVSEVNCEGKARQNYSLFLPVSLWPQHCDMWQRTDRKLAFSNVMSIRRWAMSCHGGQPRRHIEEASQEKVDMRRKWRQRRNQCNHSHKS